MKKLLLAVTAALLTLGVSAFAETEDNAEKLSFTMQKVDGPNKDGVMAFTKIYQYPATEIEDAIIEKLKEEGISGKKASNNFYAFKGVKYNSLWNQTFDFYIAVEGSQKSGTIYLVLATGYNNYIVDNDAAENKRISDWLDSLEENIKNHLYNHQLKDQQDETKAAAEDLKSLKAENKLLNNACSMNIQRNFCEFLNKKLVNFTPMVLINKGNNLLDYKSSIWIN